MKGRILGTLFALPFFGVGAWMLWSIGSTFHDAWRMQQWTPIEARLITAGYESNSGDDSTTYEVYAHYSYTFDGDHYTGDRVTIAGGADNIGDYHIDIGNALSSKRARGETITVFVDPEAPSRSIIDPGIRWGLVGFKSIFVFVFGGIGLGMLIFIWRAPKKKDATLPEYQASPWLLNHDWQTPTIRSNSKAAMWGAWAFAAFWNLISAFTPFVAWKEITEKENYVALVALVFPLIGLGLLAWAIRRTLEWRRFGPAPVMLDPFPGSIGGHVGGTIDLSLPWDSSARFQLTLTNLRSHISGSGKDRKRSETAEWQDEIVAHAEPGSMGTRLTFRFDVPEGLKPSDAQQDADDYHIWRLSLNAEIPGADIDRDYEIPVYATATQSRHLSRHAVERGRARQTELSDARVRDIIRWKNGVMGRSMFYPAGRFLWANIMVFVIGAVFAGAGYFLIVEEGAAIFGSIFGGVGALVAISAFYMATNSLEVWHDGTHLRTLRRWVGIPIRRKAMAKSDFMRLRKKKSMTTQSGGKHVIYYAIQAVDRQGNKLAVGDGFKGASQAKAAMRIIAGELGLRYEPEEKESTGESGLYDADVLTADF